LQGLSGARDEFLLAAAVPGQARRHTAPEIRDRARGGPTAPAEGLYFVGVKY
jgi:hypothetical protein